MKTLRQYFKFEETLEKIWQHEILRKYWNVKENLKKCEIPLNKVQNKDKLKRIPKIDSIFWRKKIKIENVEISCLCRILYNKEYSRNFENKKEIFGRFLAIFGVYRVKLG